MKGSLRGLLEIDSILVRPDAFVKGFGGSVARAPTGGAVGLRLSMAIATNLDFARWSRVMSANACDWLG
jgi:hypothetical protein